MTKDMESGKEYICYRCKDCFSPIINKCQKIKANKTIRNYEILYSNKIQFYKKNLIMLFLLMKRYSCLVQNA
jgi:hypothetical protein